MGYDIEKEKREAIEAGRRALNSLQTAKENLRYRCVDHMPYLHHLIPC